MATTVKKIRQIENSLREGVGKNVCPNCYFMVSDSSCFGGHYTCPCCEFVLEGYLSVDRVTPVTVEEVTSFI